MLTVMAYNAIDPSHLAEVVAEMQKLGTPVIRAVETCHGLVAIEGSHRLAAAQELGIDPEIVVIGQDEIIDGTSLNDIQGDVYASGDVDGDSINSFTVSGAALTEFVARTVTGYGETYTF